MGGSSLDCIVASDVDCEGGPSVDCVDVADATKAQVLVEDTAEALKDDTDNASEALAEGAVATSSRPVWTRVAHFASAADTIVPVAREQHIRRCVSLIVERGELVVPRKDEVEQDRQHQLQRST